MEEFAKRKQRHFEISLQLVSEWTAIASLVSPALFYPRKGVEGASPGAPSDALSFFNFLLSLIVLTSHQFALCCCLDAALRPDVPELEQQSFILYPQYPNLAGPDAFWKLDAPELVHGCCREN